VPYMLYVNPPTSRHHFEQHVPSETSVKVTVSQRRHTGTLYNALLVHLFVTPVMIFRNDDQLKNFRSFNWEAALANTFVDFP